MNEEKSETSPEPRWQYLLYGAVFKLRGVLMVPLIIGMLFATEWDFGNRSLGLALGILLFLAGFALRIRSQQYLQYRLRISSGLADAGPYAYVRNPVYIANITMFFGLCILCRTYWLAPLAVAWSALVYGLSIRFEENRLTKRFGDSFLHYREVVPRWAPLHKPSPGLQHGRASLLRALQVEWHIPLLLAVPLTKQWLLRQKNNSASPAIARALTFASTHRLLLVGVLISCVAALGTGRLAYLRTIVGQSNKSERARRK